MKITKWDTGQNYIATQSNVLMWQNKDYICQSGSDSHNPEKCHRKKEKECHNSQFCYLPITYFPGKEEILVHGLGSLDRMGKAHPVVEINE